MNIPRVIVRIGHLRPDHLDHACAGLHQAAGQQATLSKSVAAVQVTCGFRFLRQVEGISRAAGGDEVQRAIVIVVQLEIGHGLVDVRRGVVDGVTQAGAAAQAQLEHVGTHLQVVRLDVVHLVHVHVVPVRIQVVGVKRLAEESGGAALADHVAFLQRTRQHDERQHRLGRWLEADDLRAEVREVLRAGWLELAGRTDLVGRVAGHHLVDGRRVVEQTVGRVAHRADHGHLVVDLGQLGHDLGEVDAGNLGWDRLENRTHIFWCIRFWIPQIKMTRAALQIAEDDVLGLAPAGATHVSGLSGPGLQLEHVGQAEAQHARAANTQQVAA